MDYKTTELTQGRLNKMCKYFRNKRVHISYEYNNSLGWHSVTEYKGKYDDFKITLYNNIYGLQGGEIVFAYKGKTVFVWGIDEADSANFVGVGAIDILNSGPYCYFRIKKLG
jgi:hypothetical protein